MVTKGLSTVLGFVVSLMCFPVYAHAIKFPTAPAHSLFSQSDRRNCGANF